ncbi:MAG: helicase HerA-like domain-containing protein [Pseudomonadota bacterium]|jgi:DNA helicase HerA-like ATPase
MSQPLLVAKSPSEIVQLLPSMANRHGLIAGATGTGKTVTLRVLAEGFSRMGVPVFMADVKGDLAGLSQAGSVSDKLTERLTKLGIEDWAPQAYPVVLWDVLGQQGHPVRTTISELGPVLLARLLNLNDTQAGVLNIAFKAADDAGLLLLDLKDLQAMLVYLGENAQKFTLEYGNVSSASIGAIQRALLTLKESGGESLFGEPALTIDDLLQTDASGRGIINILSAEKLLNSPLVYSTLLLWLLSELFEKLPEAGDLEKPKLVFFFDEAHLLFNEAPKALIERIEQVVRLIRSKGVGVYFVSQSPLDIADTVLTQLGNRVQHALRAFTAKDQKAIKATAETFRADGSMNLQEVIGELVIGEALISLLDDRGAPCIAQRALVVPPQSRLGAITPEERKAVIESSTVYGTYEKSIDRESAYEILKKRMEEAADQSNEQVQSSSSSNSGSVLSGIFGSGTSNTAGKRTRQGPLEAMMMSVARAIGSQLGRSVSRGVFGSLTSKSRRR